MGTTISSYSDLSKNELLNRLVSKEVLQPGEPFWNSLLSFSYKPPLTKDAWRTFESNIEELLKRFLISNLKTGNFGSLIQVMLLRHPELGVSVQTENALFLWQTCNALFIVRAVVKFMSERIKEEDMVKQFGASDSEENSNLLTSFIAILVDIIIEIPVRELTYALHLEATKVLIGLLSPVLFTTSKPAHQMAGWIEMMRGKSSVLATPLSCSLLLRFTDRQHAPANLTGQEGGSLVLGLASGVWSLLTLGYGGGGGGEETAPISSTPLADASLSLLLVLLNHWTDSSLVNPYRTAVFHSANSTERGEVAQGTSFVIEFPVLYQTLASILQEDEPTLLLYLLLHRNPAFRSYVLAASDIDQLVIPILQTLYKAPESNNHLTYMSLIVVLILSEDDLFNQTVHSCVLKPAQMSWYTERSLTELSLGGLLILVVIRTIQYNMLKMRDRYLHTNCLAALANMSGLFKHLHPYVAQRLVSLFETLARKHNRLVDGLKAVDTEEVEDGFDEVKDAVQDAAVLEEVLRMLLEIINSCIVNQIKHNPNLIYAILYKREMFEIYSQNIAFKDLLQNILTVVNFMSARVEQEAEKHGRSLGVAEVQQIVREGAQQFPRDRLTRAGDLKFKYVEEEEPEDFFLPYIWNLTTDLMFWNAKHIKL